MSETEVGVSAGTERRKLVLHIGSHKTGTTSIQHNLAHNTDALAAAGLSYFYESRVPTDEPPPDLHSWLGFVDREQIVPLGMKIKDPEKLVERLGSTRGDIIISAENFSFFFAEQQIHQLHALLSQVFSDIEIVCYVRRQDRHVISHHQEGSKARRRAEYQLFGHSGRAIPPWTPSHDFYLDYHRRLSKWADVFGRDSLKVRVFDRSLLHDGDAVADFFHQLGVTSFTRVPDRNQSVGRVRAKVGHLVNATSLVHHDLISSLVRDGLADSGRSLPSRDDARDYYERFRASNEALGGWILPAGETLFDDDFSEYDTVPSDEWDEASANEVIAAMLQAMDTLASQLDPVVDKLRNTAVGVGLDSPEAAVALLRMALELRPNGPVIKQRLKEFEILAQRSSKRQAPNPLTQPPMSSS